MAGARPADDVVTFSLALLRGEAVRGEESNGCPELRPARRLLVEGPQRNGGHPAQRFAVGA
jgi:hypothetical protein